MRREFPQVVPFEDDLASDVAAGTEQIEDGARNRALARAGFTHQAQGPAGRQRERNVAHRAQGRGGAGVRDGEVAKLQERRH